MTPTLLEIALALVLLWVAWQLGVALAPAIKRGLRAMRHGLDGAHDDERDRQ